MWLVSFRFRHNILYIYIIYDIGIIRVILFFLLKTLFNLSVWKSSLNVLFLFKCNTLYPADWYHVFWEVCGKVSWNGKTFTVIRRKTKENTQLCKLKKKKNPSAKIESYICCTPYRHSTITRLKSYMLPFTY